MPIRAPPDPGKGEREVREQKWIIPTWSDEEEGAAEGVICLHSHTATFAEEEEAVRRREQTFNVSAARRAKLDASDESHLLSLRTPEWLILVSSLIRTKATDTPS